MVFFFGGGAYIGATFHSETNSFLKRVPSVYYVKTIAVIREEGVYYLGHDMLATSSPARLLSTQTAPSASATFILS